MNNALVSEGLVSSALVFGTYPATDIFVEPREPKPTTQQRSQLASSIHLEIDKQMASIRVNRALCHKIPPESDVTYKVGDQVLVCREKQVNNSIGEWLGPDPVRGVNMDCKLVYVLVISNK